MGKKIKHANDSKLLLAAVITLVVVLIGQLLENIRLWHVVPKPLLEGTGNFALFILFGGLLIIFNTASNSLLLWIITKKYKLKEKRIIVKAVITTASVEAVYALVKSLLTLLFAFLIFYTSFIHGPLPEGLVFAASIGVQILGLAILFSIASLAIKLFYRLETRKAILLGFLWTVGIVAINFLIGTVRELLTPLSVK